MADILSVQPDFPNHPGLKLSEGFCRWHQAMIAYGALSADCFDACPLLKAQAQGADLNDRSSVFLVPGISLADLTHYVGEEHWSLLRDSPATIKKALAEMQARIPAARFSSLVPHLSPAQCFAQPVYFSHSVQLLVNTLVPLVERVGLPKKDIQQSLQGLFKTVAPRSTEQALAFHFLLREHFFALQCLNRLFIPDPNSTLKQRTQEIELKDFALLRQAFSAMGQVAAAVYSAGSLLGRNSDKSVTRADICMLATAADSPESGALMVDALLGAFRAIPLYEGFTEGLLDLLAHDPPGDVVEALLRAELLVCRIHGSWLYQKPVALPEALIEQHQKEIIANGLKLELSLGKSLRWWRQSSGLGLQWCVDNMYI